MKTLARIAIAASAALLAAACSPGEEERIDDPQLDVQAEPVLNAIAIQSENAAAGEPAANGPDTPVPSDAPTADDPAPAARRAEPAAPAARRAPPPPAPAPAPPPPPADDPHAGHDMNSM